MQHKRKFKSSELALCGLFSALIAVCSWVSIPSPVPFTLQTFGVFLAVFVLGGKGGFSAVLVYILLGAAGMPVFSGFRGGIGVLFGQTGGFIWGLVLGTAFIWALEKAFGDNTAARVVSVFSAVMIIYAVGTAWFYFVYMNGEGGFLRVLKLCVFPFIVPDLVKISLAYFVGRKITARLKTMS